MTRLLSYVANNHRNTDSNVQPLTFLYHTKRHRFTNDVSINLVLSPNPPGPALSDNNYASSLDVCYPTKPIALPAGLLTRTKTVREQLYPTFPLVQNRYQQNPDETVKKILVNPPGQLRNISIWAGFNVIAFIE